MERKDFLKSSLIIGTGSIIGSTNGFSQNLTINEIDKLLQASIKFSSSGAPPINIFSMPASFKGSCSKLCCNWVGTIEMKLMAVSKFLRGLDVGRSMKSSKLA